MVAARAPSFPRQLQPGLAVNRHQHPQFGGVELLHYLDQRVGLSLLGGYIQPAGKVQGLLGPAPCSVAVLSGIVANLQASSWTTAGGARAVPRRRRLDIRLSRKAQARLPIHRNQQPKFANLQPLHRLHHRLGLRALRVYVQPAGYVHRLLRLAPGAVQDRIAGPHACGRII